MPCEFFSLLSDDDVLLPLKIGKLHFLPVRRVEREIGRHIAGLELGHRVLSLQHSGGVRRAAVILPPGEVVRGRWWVIGT